MLRLSKTLLAAVAVAALLSSSGASAQLSGRLDAAEQKLAQDTQSCTPINIGEYQSLLHEAAKNKKRAEKAKKAGAPVDEAQVNADLTKASELFNRALGAHVQQCVRQATRQPPPAQNQSQSTNNLSPFAKEVLAIHNAERARVGAQPLKWNPALAARASVRARELAQAGQLTHSPREGRGTIRENIVQAPANYSTAQIMDRWMRERSEFVPGTFPNVCKTGGGCSGILHYSQAIWPKTTDIGCDLVESGGYDFGVCFYDRGGNKDGEPVGIPVASQDIADNAEPPDLAGNIRLDQGWGSAQLMGVVGMIHDSDDPNAPTTDLDAAAPLIADILAGDGTSSPPGNTKVETPRLPTAEVFKGGGSGFDRPPGYAEDIRVEQGWGGAQLSAILHQLQGCPAAPVDSDPLALPTPLLDAGIYGGGASIGSWFNPGTPLGVVLLNPAGDGTSHGWIDFADTKVETPDLPTKEVFNPDDWKKTACDIM